MPYRIHSTSFCNLRHEANIRFKSIFVLDAQGRQTRLQSMQEGFIASRGETHHFFWQSIGGALRLRNGSRVVPTRKET